MMQDNTTIQSQDMTEIHNTRTHWRSEHAAWMDELASWQREQRRAASLRQLALLLAGNLPDRDLLLPRRLRRRGIFIKPLGDPILGPGFMRVTTALPSDNLHFIQSLRELYTC